MSPTPAVPKSDSHALGSLLERCLALCGETKGSLGALAQEKQEFLTTNLRDALENLELILRVLDKESGRKGEPQGLLGRLTRGLAKRETERGEPRAELPELSVSRQGLQGTSWTIPLTELVGFLAYGRKTGVLWVDSPEENFLLGLEDGRLMHATSDRTPEGLRVGEILVGQGFLTRTQLERFLAQRAEGEEELAGESLLTAGMINADELHGALVHQVQQLFLRLIDTKSAIFRFREGMRVQLAYQVDLNIPKLLLESARVHDELSTEDSRLKAIVGDLAGHGAAAGVPEDWDTWNQEMLSELRRMVVAEGAPPEGPADEPADEATPTAPTRPSPRSKG